MTARGPVPDSVQGSRSPRHRAPVFALPADPGGHVLAEGDQIPSKATEVRALCGATFQIDPDTSWRDMPHVRLLVLEDDLGCLPCAEAALATPFVHRVRVGRVQTGRSAIRSGNGGGLYYATTMKCTCGESDQVNSPPSRGGESFARQWTREHYALVQAEAEQGRAVVGRNRRYGG